MSPPRSSVALLPRRATARATDSVCSISLGPLVSPLLEVTFHFWRVVCAGNKCDQELFPT